MNSAPMPDKRQILEFLSSHDGHKRPGKREIARAFNLRGAQREELKALLKEMAREGLISHARKKIVDPASLPAVALLEVIDQDWQGDLLARPVRRDRDGGEVAQVAAPVVRLLAPRGGTGAAGRVPGIGDRVLTRLTKLAVPEPVDETLPAVSEAAPAVLYHGRVIKNLGRARGPQVMLGIYQAGPGGRAGRVESIDRKAMKEWPVAPGAAADDVPKSGELVRFRLVRSGYQRQAVIEERLGHPEDQRQISLIAIHKHDIPLEFPPAVLEEVARLPAPTMKQRQDLTRLPFITIDPEDARDHDDAVFAEPDPDHEGGHLVWVAIADVAQFVRPGSQLDKEARKRGNSVYFPDRVVHMLPEALAADLCSLKAGQARPVLVVRLQVTAEGRVQAHKFMRAMIRPVANLSYEQAQAAIDGESDAMTAPLLDTVLVPLWAAYEALARARDRRQPLDLDLPERKIILGEMGKVAEIRIPERLEAHRLIENFMIAANVAAARTLRQADSPRILRNHEPPAREKISALSEFLKTLNINFTKAGTIRPQRFNEVLARVRGTDSDILVNETILRSQTQAYYGTENKGHFGLNLTDYAHFTSPIRRYADLIVHRALISALNLGDDGLTAAESAALPDIAEHISDTERRAMAAERETSDRLMSHYLAERVGAVFAGRISGLSRAGMFVRLSETGADGFIPMRSIGDEYFIHDDSRHCLIGQDSGELFRLGDAVEVRLLEAIPAAGALRFELVSGGRVASKAERQSMIRRHAGRSGTGRRAAPHYRGRSRKGRRR